MLFGHVAEHAMAAVQVSGSSVGDGAVVLEDYSTPAVVSNVTCITSKISQDSLGLVTFGMMKGEASFHCSVGVSLGGAQTLKAERMPEINTGKEMGQKLIFPRVEWPSFPTYSECLCPEMCPAKTPLSVMLGRSPVSLASLLFTLPNVAL